MEQKIQVPTLEEVVQLMAEILKGNNDTIMKASQILKEYTKELVSTQVLLNLLLNANNANFRQLASVLLKRNINQHYCDMEPNDQKFLKQALLERYFTEPERAVRRSIGFLIGTLTKVTLPKRDWNELLQIISQRTDSQQPLEVREGAIYLLGLILDISAEHFIEHFKDFYNFFKMTIADSAKSIRYQSLKCILYLFENVSESEHIGMFTNLVEPILKVVDECVTDRQDEIVNLAFTVFCELAEVESPLFNEKVYTALSYFVCSERILLNKNIDTATQSAAVDFLADIAQSHKTVYTKNQDLLQHLVDTLCLLTLNKSKSGDIEDSESLQDLALNLINELTMQIAKKKVYPLFKQNIEKFLQANDPWKLEAALFILGYISEGCADSVKRDLDKYIKNLIQPALASQVPEVRAAGIYAICFFSENLVPEIISYHSLIIPTLLKHVDDMDKRVAQRTLFTIELFCTNMEEEVIQYIDQLVPSIISALDNPKSTMYMRRLSISSISSIIDSSVEKFIPQIPAVAPLMGQLIIQIPGNSELLPLRAEATSCLGKMAYLLKDDRDAFIKLVKPYLEGVWTGLQTIKDPEIREHSFAFFYNVAYCLKDDFKPFLESLMDLIYQSIMSKEGVQKKKANTLSLDSDSSGEDDTRFHPTGSDVKMEFIEEKNAAIHAMGEFSKACPLLFVPYFERTIKILGDMNDFWYANTRMQVAVCYKNLIEGLILASNGGKLPEYAKGLPCNQRFKDQIEAFIEVDYFAIVIHYLTEDESPEVTSATLETLQDAVKKFGPAFIDKNLERLMEAILKLLQNKAVCQTGAEDESDDVDINGLIFGNVTELLSIIAKVLKDSFAPAYKLIHKTLKRFLKLNHSVDDISLALGAIGDCFKYSPALVQNYFEDLLPPIFECVEVNEDLVSRNIAFTLGVFCAHGKELVVSYYSKIMQVLKHIFDNSALEEAKDNAVAAIAKMVYTQPAKMPLNIVVPTVMSVLPFKGDLPENKTAVKMIIFLLENNAQALNGYEEKAIIVLIDAIANWSKYLLKEKYIKACGVTLKALASSNEQIQKIIEQQNQGYGGVGSF